MTNLAADGKTKNPKQAIPVSLLRSFGAFEEDYFYHIAVPTELAIMLIRESKRVQQQFFNIQYPYRSDTMAKRPR
jgi:hypothetical protein